MLRNRFSQCSETGRKWWVGSRDSSGNELTGASTYISGMAYTGQVCIITFRAREASSQRVLQTVALLPRL